LKVIFVENQYVMGENILQKNGWDMNNCPVRSVLDRFGDKWSILVMLVLGEREKLRFNELNKEITDVSQKMLTVTLRTLEADGLVSRTIYPEVPPRVEYAITDLGKSLVPHIHSLARWAVENMSTIKQSREKFGL
jgi:DNA-binding HxlR family transcriptional regulator